MSSQSRSRVYERSRSKEMTTYRSSSPPYSSKSRSEIDSRKRDSYTSRDGGSIEKHRDAPYSKPSRRSLDERKDSYISSNERRDSTSSSKVERDNYSSRGSRENYSKGNREKEYYDDTRDHRESFSSRDGRDSYQPRGGRGSYSSRGKESFSNRGGRDSSRGSYSMRGSRDSFSNSRGSYGSMRGGGRESFTSRGSYGNMRGNRDSYSSRGSYGSPRGSYGPPRGGREFSSRGSYGNRGGRDSFSNRGRESFSGGRGVGGRGTTRGGFRGSSHRGMRSEHFLSNMGPREQLELTKKLVAHVLEDSEGRGHYQEERPYRMKEFKREGRGFYHRDSERPYNKEGPRNYNNYHSSFNHGDKMIKRDKPPSAHFDKERFMYSEKSKMGNRNKFREAPVSKRMHDDVDDEFDDDEEGPPLKHPRITKRDKYRDQSPAPDSFDFERRGHSTSPQPKEERHSKTAKERDSGSIERSRLSKSSERAKKKSDRDIKAPAEETKAKASSSKKSSEETEEEEHEEEDRGKVKVKRKFSREDDEEEYEERRGGGGRETSPSGMQVTIRSDGERAVNSEGHVKSRISGKIFVDLQCPHCPGQRSITFKEYRYHLDSRGHRVKIDKLTHKHSVVLRRIRLQQRNEQRENEEKWETDNPEEFKTTVSRYCNTCKLAYKCLSEDKSSKGISDHNESKLHKVQKRYLYPQCVMCRMCFPSRLVYEYHLASIRHLKMQTVCHDNGREGSVEATSREDDHHADKEEIDLKNFITMDSVGEDEEIGSEQEEITGKLEDVEKAEEDAKEGEDEEEEEEEEEGRAGEEEEPFDLDVEEELDHEIDEPTEEPEREICVFKREGRRTVSLNNRWSFQNFRNGRPKIRMCQSVGKEYIIPIEAFYCKLCHKAIRTDIRGGKNAVDRHCSSEPHLENFHYLGSEEFLEEHGEQFEDEGQFDAEAEEMGEEEEHEVEGGEEEVEVEEEEEEKRVTESLDEEMEEHGEDISQGDLEDEAPKDEEALEEVTLNGK